MKYFPKMILSYLIACSLHSYAAEQFPWPNNQKAAVSLSYDDALNSHLDNAIPQLNKHQLKGSFYLNLGADPVSLRLAEWRQAAAAGHELANHSLYHNCSASKPWREWVTPEQDLDKQTIASMKNDILLANRFLAAIDGIIDESRARTLTLPCGESETSNGSYLPAIKDHFIGIKAHVSDQAPPVNKIDAKHMWVWTPFDAPNKPATGKMLIEYVERAAKAGSIANITFHGIGGDHLSVSKKAHEELLTHLAANPKKYWVANYRTIAQHIAKVKDQGTE